MSDEAEIRKVLEDRLMAIKAKNAPAVVGFYGDDIVNFDLTPPLAQRGREATDPAELQAWFDTWDGPIDLEFNALEVRAAGDLSIAFGLLHMTGNRTDGSRTDIWTRFTACLERRSGSWKIVHEHQSFPMKMDGSGMAASDLRP